jgi:hypothetical protein
MRRQVDVFYKTLGVYETWIGVNKVQLDASVKMVDALVEMFGELKASEAVKSQ